MSTKELIAKENLKNKPLVEAIVDVRWALRKDNTKPLFDPNYPILIGRFQERIQNDYPEYCRRPEAELPIEMIPYVAQHQFRAEKGGWPLVQLGSGIVTINDTEKYTREDFKSRANKVIDWLFDAYPQKDELSIISISLKYIDAIEFNCLEGNILDFIAENLKLDIKIPSEMFESIEVDSQPRQFAWQTSFASIVPKGMFHMKFATALNKGKPVLLWETTIESAEKDAIPEMPQDFGKWLDEAHFIAHNSFFKLIEGNLERKFS